MKLLKRFILITAIILLSTSVTFAANIRAFNGRTGGTAGKLDSIGDASLATGDMGLVFDQSNKTMYDYWFDADASESSDNDPWWIRPDDYDGDGVWYLMEAYAFYPTDDPCITLRDVTATDFDPSLQLCVTCTDYGSGTEDCDFSVKVPIAGVLTTVMTIDADGYFGIPAHDLNLASGKVYRINGTALSEVSETLTNKTLDADDNVIQDMPYDIAWSLVDPADADIHYIRLQRAVTASSIGCIVDPEGTGESVVLNLLECDSNGDNCATVLSSTITCANTPTAGTLSDTAWAASAFLKIDIGTVTGTVKTLSIYGTGKESY